MATYFCSDLHGEYDLFRKLLDSVGYEPGDRLYVLGDIIDKGGQAFRLVDFLSGLPNAYAVKGNHERAFLQYRRSVLQEFGAGEEYEKRIRDYFPSERAAFCERYAEYLEGLPGFIEGKTFIAVHAGVALDKTNRILPMEEQDPNVLVYDRNFKEEKVVPVGSKTVLFGHTPCSYDNGTGTFIKTLRKGVLNGKRLTDYAKIRLDTGVSQTGMLGLLRANDMAEFYVRKED